MNPRHYHTPITPATSRVRCPVCHETVYSRAGIHPQCAVKQSEPPRPKPKPPVNAGTEALAAEPVAAELLVVPPTAV